MEGIWIGVKRNADDQWMTQRGVRVTSMFSDWAPEYPKRDVAANCVKASKAHGYRWINTNCDGLNSAICALTRPNCPPGYQWLPQIADSCFRISSGASFEVDSGSL